MTFEEKFVELANPFFELVEPVGANADTKVNKYYELLGDIPSLKRKLADLAKGDPQALGELIDFFTNEDTTEFLVTNDATAFSKILALASNVTVDTWSIEVAENFPFQVNFLQEDERIDQPYDRKGNLLTHYFFNSTYAVNSVAYIDFRSNPEVGKLSRPETWSAQGTDLVEIWSMILLLQNIEKVEGGVAVISSEENSEKTVSYLKYHLVMSGNKLTLPVPRPAPYNMSDIQESLSVNTNYAQFIEPFAMLGEVNSCNSILDAFLSTYHVLENYMIRSEVSAVLSNSIGRNFQRIRDFKRLGQQTDAREVALLSKLFNRCWAITVGSNLLSETLQQSFDGRHGDPDWNEDDFNEFLMQLGVLNGNGSPMKFANDFNSMESCKKNFAKLVYSIRCSIVHNKATEFHLSNEELKRKNIRVFVVVNICLPVMYKLAFGLPSSEPEANPIHYNQRELKFY